MEKFKDNEIIILSDGRKVAIDRSVGVVLLCYTKNPETNEIYILINKRGRKTSEFKEVWNLPSGYIGWNESGEEAAVRETLEETGLEVNLDDVIEVEHSTSPKENRQNIIFRYAAKISWEIMKKSTNLKPQDKDEVLEIKWIKEKELNTIPWAFNQEETVRRLLKKLLT